MSARHAPLLALLLYSMWLGGTAHAQEGEEEAAIRTHVVSALSHTVTLSRSHTTTATTTKKSKTVFVSSSSFSLPAQSDVFFEAQLKASAIRAAANECVCVCKRVKRTDG